MSSKNLQFQLKNVACEINLAGLVSHSKKPNLKSKNGDCGIMEVFDFKGSITERELKKEDPSVATFLAMT